MPYIFGSLNNFPFFSLFAEERAVADSGTGSDFWLSQADTKGNPANWPRLFGRRYFAAAEQRVHQTFLVDGPGTKSAGKLFDIWPFSIGSAQAADCATQTGFLAVVGEGRCDDVAAARTTRVSATNNAANAPLGRGVARSLVKT